jgi:hypothetical protein
MPIGGLAGAGGVCAKLAAAVKASVTERRVFMAVSGAEMGSIAMTGYS